MEQTLTQEEKKLNVQNVKRKPHCILSGTKTDNIIKAETEKINVLLTNIATN